MTLDTQGDENTSPRIIVESMMRLTTSHASEDDSSVLLRLLHEAPPEMLGHVLDKLPPVDRAMLSRVDRAWRTSVGATGMSLA